MSSIVAIHKCSNVIWSSITEVTTQSRKYMVHNLIDWFKEVNKIIAHNAISKGTTWHLYSDIYSMSYTRLVSHGRNWYRPRPSLSFAMLGLTFKSLLATYFAPLVESELSS